MSLQLILDDCGITITRYEPVHGGDINRSFCLYGPDARYFLKVNDASRYPRMFEKEANGLNALQQSGSLTIPAVIKAGIVDQQQYLLLEWIDRGTATPRCWEKFGVALASMHQQQQTKFGWKEDNYIGSLPQRNTPYSSWAEFYRECRIMPLVTRLAEEGSFDKNDVDAAISLCNKFDQLFPAEPPSLLHGDLWSGNYMITSNGEAAVFDPAIYCGHREMDLGMTRLFGGFDERFYSAYNKIYPLEKDWETRLPLTQLYPLLVHAVLFDGHYISNARSIIRDG
jgi:protein-ribulosamine 3-kinase